MRDVVLIVGMHRSGSSVLTRSLSLCGGALPIEMLPPNRWNPTGYWEPLRAMEIDEMFLRACGSSWHDVSLRLQTHPPERMIQCDYVTLIGQLLRRDFETDGPLLVKEPRVTMLLPYWVSAAVRLGHAVKIVHVLRHPAEVASSLAERDGLELDHSLALWLKYNLIGERDGRALRRTFVSYDELLDDWRPALARCASELDLELTVDDVAQAKVAAFVSGALCHHRDTSTLASASDPRLAQWASAAYEALLTASLEADVGSSALDDIFAAYSEGQNSRPSGGARFIPATEMLPPDGAGLSSRRVAAS